MSTWCVHQHKLIGIEADPVLAVDRPLYGCTHDKHPQATFMKCLKCKDFASASLRPAGHPQRHPPGTIVDRYGRPAHVADLYLNAGCFLVLSGPSLSTLPLDMLSRRGVITMTTNNCVAAFPDGVTPDLWTFTDKASKMHDSTWKDPSILKLCPVRESQRKLHTKLDSGEWEELAATGTDMPGTLYYHRNTDFNPSRWLNEPTVNRGNGKDEAKINRYPKTINTMFAALKLLYYLGFSRVYLCGCDFRMDVGKVYAFNETKHGGGCGSNNNAYANMNLMFESLNPYFSEAGFNVINCTPDSHCSAFPAMTFEEAIERETCHIRQEMDTYGWYNHVED
jgi:hypothetical protein